MKAEATMLKPTCSILRANRRLWQLTVLLTLLPLIQPTYGQGCDDNCCAIAQVVANGAAWGMFQGCETTNWAPAEGEIPVLTGGGCSEDKAIVWAGGQGCYTLGGSQDGGMQVLDNSANCQVICLTNIGQF